MHEVNYNYNGRTSYVSIISAVVLVRNYCYLMLSAIC